MATIEVEPIGGDVFRVEVREGETHTVHEVTARAADVTRYAGDTPADVLVRTSFEFLLAREPKESILRSFDLPVIERYFPEFSVEIRKLLP